MNTDAASMRAQHRQAEPQSAAELDTARRHALRSGLALIGCGTASLCGAGLAAAQTAKPLERTGGPYVPTPWPVVDQMIRTGQITAKDLVMDLGCGDGRLVIAAAQRHGARGLGVDIDPELVKLANATAQKEGVAQLARFEVRDIFATDVREATVLTLYLLPAMMLNLRPKLLAELRPGARIVAHDYHFGEWRPDSQLTIDVPEKKAITGVPSATIYFWVVPARVEGRWQMSAPAGSGLDRGELVLRQTFQDVTGTLALGGRPAQRIDVAFLRGDELRFGITVEGKGGKPGRAMLRSRLIMPAAGSAEGERIEGTIDSPFTGETRFTALRAKA
jgi:SAM-dependent methyltransferase